MSTNTPAIATPSRSLAAIDGSLRPASKAEITRGLGRLFAAFHTADAGDMVDLRMAVYFEALRDLPASCIDAAIHEFLTGQIPEHDGRFLPTCAQVAKRARFHVELDHRRAARAARYAEFEAAGQIEDRRTEATRRDPGFRQLAASIRLHRAESESA